MPKRVILPVLFCLISILTIDNVNAALTFGTSSVPYETLETEHFLVRYEPGDESAAEDVVKALEGSYERITEDLGLMPNGKTIVELYTTPRLYNQYRKPVRWAIGGKVYAGRNLMVFPSPSTWGKANIHRYEDLWHVIPHEFVHVVLRKHRIPMWLDEGIAVYESNQWSKGDYRELKEAIEEDVLLSLKELEDFNTFLENGALSYAESYSAIVYMREAYGDDSFRQLLKIVSYGMGFQEALKKATGKTSAEFEAEWRAYLHKNIHVLNPDVDAYRISIEEAMPVLPMAPPDKNKLDNSIDIRIQPKDGWGHTKEVLPPPWLLVASLATLLAMMASLRVLKTFLRIPERSA